MKVALVGDYDATVVAHLFASSDFHFCAHDQNGEPRAFELDKRRFFCATAWQPERSSLRRMTHPLITAFLMAEQ